MLCFKELKTIFYFLFVKQVFLFVYYGEQKMVFENSY